MAEGFTWEPQKSGGSVWLPEKQGDILEGEVVAVKVDGQYGKQFEVRRENGDVVLTPSHKVLQSRMTHVEVGHKVRIVAGGTELPKIKGRNPTQLYEVFIARPNN